MGSRLLFVFIICTALSGCGLGDTTDFLANGYYYNDWGRKFITHKKAATGQDSIVIDSEIISYVLDNDVLAAVQLPELLETGNTKPVYWLIDTRSEKIESFTDCSSFRIATTQMGLSPRHLENLDNAKCQ